MPSLDLQLPDSVTNLQIKEKGEKVNELLAIDRLKYLWPSMYSGHIGLYRNQTKEKCLLMQTEHMN